MPQYMTTAEVAELSRLSPETLRYYRWKRIGPPSFNIGRKVLYDRTEVLAWIKAQKAKASAA